MVKTTQNIPLARLGQLHIPALDKERVLCTRNFRMLTAAWIVAPWDMIPPQPRKRAG